MQVMGEPYPSAAWAHYYHAAGGTYVHWPHFQPPQGYFHPGVQQQPHYNTQQQTGFGFYQTQWNQTCQGFSQSHTYQSVQEVQAAPTSNKDAYREEASSSNTDSYDPMPMDISPNASPVKRTVAATKRDSIEIAPRATSRFTEVSAQLKSLLESSPERPQASLTTKTLKVVKFQCPDPLNAPSSVLSLLEKCISCTKKILAVAKGEGSTAVTEPCTCKHRSAPCEILQSNPQSLGMTKKALEKSLGRPITATRFATVEHTLPSEGRTTRDFKKRCRSRWEPLARSNLDHAHVGHRLPVTSSTAVSEDTKPLSVSSHSQPAAYFGSKGPTKKELPQSLWKVAISKSAEMVTGRVPTMPHHQISPDSDNPVKTVMQAASHKSDDKCFTVDVCIGEKVKGEYIPDSTIDTSQTTCINIKVDAMLGGCVEMRDGPAELPCELEKLDEGWVLSFD